MQRWDGWAGVVLAALGVAGVSLLSNITSIAQLSGEADNLLAVRFTLSKVVNSGVVWAGLAVLSGWLVKRPGQAFFAGIVACLLALAAHYGMGALLGMFDADVWSDNAYWFAAAMILGGPLGVVGSVARRPGGLGMAARLLVPVAALAEPFVTRKFSNPDFLPWPDRISNIVSGVVIFAGGVLGLVLILAAARRKARTGEERPHAASRSSSGAGDGVLGAGPSQRR